MMSSIELSRDLHFSPQPRASTRVTVTRERRLTTACTSLLTRALVQASAPVSRSPWSIGSVSDDVTAFGSVRAS
ncbi:hypothetical protein BgiBS90_001356 [Biomphalaria glabrata]|nr:hypothetical protein BgiBS90_001356 [Biomphalaria glabrata]